MPKRHSFTDPRHRIAHPDEAQCIILEPHGDHSVIRTGAPLDLEMFTDVVCAQEHLFERTTEVGRRIVLRARPEASRVV